MTSAMTENLKAAGRYFVFVVSKIELLFIQGCKIIRDPGSDPYCFVEFLHHQAASAALTAMNKRSDKRNSIMKLFNRYFSFNFLKLSNVFGLVIDLEFFCRLCLGKEMKVNWAASPGITGRFFPFT
jgi:hypothetical protein